jgi:hypothetical protein
MIATRYIYFSYTQLVSTTGPVHRVSDHVCLSIDSGGLRPRALGNDHATDAVPKTRLGDGCAREQGWFKEQDI